jgi:hypothetical protein
MTCPSEDKNECSEFQILLVLLSDIAFEQVIVDDRVETLLGITRKGGCYKVKRISCARSCINKVIASIYLPPRVTFKFTTNPHPLSVP